MSKEASRVDDAAQVGIRELLDGSGLPLHEAERLLVTASGRDRLSLLRETRVNVETAARFAELAERRRTFEPLQHLEGGVQFGPLELHSDGRALVPRPETELLWEIVVERASGLGPSSIVDLCTGSGNLALGLKQAFPAAAVYGTDTSTEALALAAENSAVSGLEVEWLHGDLFAALPERLLGEVDLLVANPPYVAEREFADLPVDVRDHEPYEALVSGPVGDEVLARIASEAPQWLRPGALVACEISEFQKTRALELFGSLDGEVLDDLTGRPRFVIGRA
jgi:release factor glutamine methyltransferase